MGLDTDSGIVPCARPSDPGQVRVPEPAPPKGEHHPEKVLRRKFHRIKARAARSGEGSLVKGPLREAVQGEAWARTHGSDCCGTSPGRDGGSGVARGTGENTCSGCTLVSGDGWSDLL